MEYVNELSEALYENGILWSQARVITSNYIERLDLIKASMQDITKMAYEAIASKQIVLQNKDAHSDNRQTPHYTYNDLLDKGVPYNLLECTSPLCLSGKTPRRIIKGAQGMIIKADDSNYRKAEENLDKAKMSALFTKRLLREIAKSDASSLLETFPDLEKIDKEAMKGLRKLLSGEEPVSFKKVTVLENKLKNIEAARKLVAESNYTGDEIKAILSIDWHTLSNEPWEIVRNLNYLK